MKPVPPFAVLFVCTGNICRSPLGERLLQARLASSGLESGFEVASAGVMAMTGWGMDPHAAAQLAALGGDAGGFTARQCADYMLANADLILTATRAHRERVLEDCPGALKRTFTILEFANLLQGAPPEATEGKSPSELVQYAAKHRSAVTLADVDVPDPYRASEATHAEVAQLISDAVDEIVRVFAR